MENDIRTSYYNISRNQINISDYIDYPLKINMINMIGNINTYINIEKLFDIADQDFIIQGFRYKGKTKGDVVAIKSEQQKSMNNSLTIYVNISGYYNYVLNKNEEHRIIKAKLFCSGAIHIPGCRLIIEGHQVVHLIEQKIRSIDSKYYDILEIKDITQIKGRINPYDSMFTTQYQFKNIYIDRIKLCNILTNSPYNCIIKYKPKIYPGLKVFYYIQCRDPNDKKNKITCIIQKSGIIGINGANEKYKFREVYNFINKVLIDNWNEVVICNASVKAPLIPKLMPRTDLLEQEEEEED